MDFFQSIDWGIAGILAGIIFFAYKNLVKQMRDDRKYMQDEMKGIITQYHEDSKADTESRVENTRIQSELFQWLRGKNGHT